jgi:glyoxylate reductase
MIRPSILATHPLFPEARTLLDAHCDVEYWKRPERPPRAEFLKQVASKDCVVCLLTEKIDKEMLAAAPRLRMVANVAVGYDNISVPDCTARKVVVTNTPGVLDETTADFAWTLLMCVARRVGEGEALCRSGEWAGWNLDQMCGGDVWGKTLGVIGFGRIGRAVARRSRGFGMKVIYTDAIRAPENVEHELGAKYVDMDALLADADFVTVHVPMMAGTHHLINAERLKKMKRTAYLVNTARGPVVDNEALYQALKAGTIAGAGVDVHEHEPKIHAGLVSLKNVVLTPHIASASIETRTKMACIAAENVLAFFEGRRPPNLVNPDVLG